MQLSRMQDLGGCRAILSDIKRVEILRQQYKRSRDRHELATEKDYIKLPQESGYRGIHLIYKYTSDRSRDYNNHRVEVQLRTAVQHAWATAVEIAGIYVRTPLKSSIGPEKWLEFFKYSSSAFSILEDAPRLHSDLSEREIFENLRSLNDAIDVVNKLKGFTSAHKHIHENKRKTDSHFILVLDLAEQKTTIHSYGTVMHASERYAEMEKNYIDNDMIDVVLVAAESIESVASAYPNYFADTREFLRLMGRVLE